jgi:hypothetical protein
MRKIRIKDATEPQRQFWAAGEKFVYFRGGVGSGKTVAGAVKAMSMPRGSTGMVLAPTYPMLRDATLRTFLDITRKAGVLRHWYKGEHTAVLAGNRTVYFRTAKDPEKLRGPNLGWFWPDEACLMNPLVWPIMIGRLREHPRKAWLTSTPRGKNWVHDTFAKGGLEYALVRASSRTNLFQPEEFVRSMLDNYSEDFARQEIDGEVLDDFQEALLPEWWLDRMEQATAPKNAPAGRRRMGVDLGYGSGRDASTIIVRDDLGILWAMESSYVGVAQAAQLVSEWSQRLKVRHEDITFDAAGPGRDMPRYLEQYGIVDAVKYYGEQSGYHQATNRRSLVAWRMRERLDPQRPLAWSPDGTERRHPLFAVPAAPSGVPTQHPFGLPTKDRSWWPRLREELKALKFTMVKRKVCLEKKADLIARLKRSPNLLDALLMTFNHAEAA